MSLGLRARLTLLLAAVVVVTLLAGGAAINRGVVVPFSKAVFDSFLDQAVYAAEEVAAGRDPSRLGQELGLKVRALHKRLPQHAAGWRAGTHQGHAVAYERKGKRAVVVVETRGGWVLVSSRLDLEKPLQGLRLALLAVGVTAVLGSAWLAGAATRPLVATREAMRRITDGDLEHRLGERGPRELAELARAFNAMAERVAEMLRGEKELMAGISHELRTPLTRLRLEVELLRDMEAASPRRLDAMEGDLAELDRLIGELLEISRLELGRESLTMGPTDLRAVAEEAVEKMPLPEHKVVIEGAGAALEGDHARLVRVVTNLLQNAGKYTPAGGRVEVRVQGRSLEVADRGPGVPAGDLEHIFSPFHRVDRSRSRKTGGVGLGLMIARKVARGHGGSISARNRDGGGLVVRLELPED